MKRKLFLTSELANLLGVCRQTIWQWIQKGHFLAAKKAGRFVITPEEVAKLLENFGMSKSDFTLILYEGGFQIPCKAIIGDKKLERIYKENRLLLKQMGLSHLLRQKTKG